MRLEIPLFESWYAYAERHNRETIEMKTVKTVMMAMIVAFVAIGMTGFAMAGSTTQTTYGDGSYNMNYNGRDGTVSVNTYTSYGEDHMTTTFDGRGHGYQNMGTGSSWTEIDRRCVTKCGDGVTKVQTYDTSGEMIAAYTDSTKKTVLRQDVAFGTAFGGEGVIADTTVRARGNYEIGIYTVAGYGAAETGVEIDGRGRAKIHSYAAAVTDGAGIYATGQYLPYWGCASAYAPGPHRYGDAYIYAAGNEHVGWDISGTNDGVSYDTDGHLNGGAFDLDDEFDNNYYATGYIYAVSAPVP